MKTRLIAGIGLIILGVGFLLGEMGLFSFWSVLWTYWPTALVISGIIHLSKLRASIFNGIALIVIGTLFQASILDIIPLSFLETLISAGLILLGTSLLLGSRKFHNGLDTINVVSIFSGANRIVTSQHFSGGSITTLFGGADIDLRKANLENGRAEIEISCMFGGCDIKVPEHWEIDMSGIPILGGASDSTKPRFDVDEIRPKLSISYFVIFGGFDIKS